MSLRVGLDADAHAGSAGERGNPSTMQFLIERICPELIALVTDKERVLADKAEAILPFVCWVELSESIPAPRDGRACSSSITYRMTLDSHAEFLAKAGITVPAGRVVCEHMGHLIE